MRRTRKNQVSISISKLTDIHKSLFENMGWMVLAKENEMNLKVQHYVDDIKELCRLLKKKLDTTHEQDIKIDLKTMLDQTEILLKSVTKLFNI